MEWFILLMTSIGQWFEWEKKKKFSELSRVFLRDACEMVHSFKEFKWTMVMFLRDACVVFGYDIKWHPFDAILKVATHKSHRIIVWFYWFFVFSLFCFTFLFFFFWYNLIIFWVYLFISPFNNLNWLNYEIWINFIMLYQRCPKSFDLRFH